jgi:DoxX-like family
MFVAYAVVAIVLSVALVASGGAKLTNQPRVVDGIGGLGVPLSWFPALALAEIAGAIGLIIGLWVPALGIAAGIGVVLYFLGALAAHLRANDRGFAAPVVLGLLAVAAIALRIASL